MGNVVLFLIRPGIIDLGAASSYGHFIAAKEFRSQYRILRVWAFAQKIKILQASKFYGIIIIWLFTPSRDEASGRPAM